MSNFVALVVEDDAVQREFVAELLKDGLEVVECSTAEAAEFWCPRERNFWPW